MQLDVTVTVPSDGHPELMNDGRDHDVDRVLGMVVLPQAPLVRGRLGGPQHVGVRGSHSKPPDVFELNAVAHAGADILASKRLRAGTRRRHSEEPSGNGCLP